MNIKDIIIKSLFKNKNCRTFVYTTKLQPVYTNEPLSFRDLKGYEKQKEVLYKNTKSLLEGKKVNNILLYGDSGCGKSTSIRALLNEFPDINIVQIAKDNLINLDKLYQIIQKKKKKFIIFADDISFDENDSTLSTMKAILEGSLIQCPNNAAIYATSNRRRLIKESFQSRMGDEIHLGDTLNEITSLSERFGINLIFLKPNQSDFLDIVSKLADDYNISLPKEELFSRAKQFALRRSSTSPRIARQFIENISLGIDL